MPRFYYSQTVAGSMLCGALSDNRAGLSFETTADSLQRSHFGFESRKSHCLSPETLHLYRPEIRWFSLLLGTRFERCIPRGKVKELSGWAVWQKCNVLPVMFEVILQISANLQYMVCGLRVSKISCRKRRSSSPPRTPEYKQLTARIF